MVGLRHKEARGRQSHKNNEGGREARGCSVESIAERGMDTARIDRGHVILQISRYLSLMKTIEQ